MNGHQIQMNGHQNKKQIGQNNHLQALFSNHFYNRSNCKWFRWIVIEISSKLVETITSKHYLEIIFFVKLQVISMNCHRNQKQIGQNNHLQTLFNNHFYIILYYFIWFWRMVIKIICKLVKTITSKHYFTLTPILCQLGKNGHEYPITSKL